MKTKQNVESFHFEEKHEDLLNSIFLSKILIHLYYDHHTLYPGRKRCYCCLQAFSTEKNIKKLC